MINEHEYLLICIAEEAAEVQQRITKILRFGKNEIQPGQPKDNTLRLMEELTDLIAAIELYEDRCGSLGMTDSGKDAKRDRILEYMQYSRDQGTLQ